MLESAPAQCRQDWGDVVCVGSRSFLAVPSRSLVHPLKQSTLSVSSSTAMPPPMFEEPCHAALLPYGSCITYVDMLPMTASILLWCPLCIRGWTTAISFSVFLPISNDTSRPFSTLQLVWFDSIDTITSPMSSDITLARSLRTGEFQTCADGISGSAWHGASVFEWTLSRITPAMSTPSPVIIYTPADHSIISSDNYRPSLVSCCSRNCLPVSGTLCLSMSSHHLLLQPFATIWRHSCFNSHFRTSSSDITNYVTVYFVMTIAILATLKNSDWLIDRQSIWGKCTEKSEPVCTCPNSYHHNECVLFHNLKNLDRSERNAPRSFSPDCIDLVVI